MKANLHVHSYFSDGAESPERLVELAVDSKIELFSLTDHNTFDGYERFVVACNNYGLPFVRGVEIDCVQPEIGFYKEVLAYFPNGGETELYPLLNRKKVARLKRVERALRGASKLYGVDNVSLDELINDIYSIREFNGMISNKTVHTYLKCKGVELKSYRQMIADDCHWCSLWKRTENDFFDSLYEIISLVKKIGGVTVLPHFAMHCNLNPCNMIENEAMFLKQLHTMKEYGLWGIEIHPYRYLPVAGEINSIVKRWAGVVGLSLTNGSDFHGGVISEHNMFDFYGVDFHGFQK